MKGKQDGFWEVLSFYALYSILMSADLKMPDEFFESLEGIPAAEVKAFEFVRQWISDYTGLHFAHSRHLSLYRRLESLCKRSGLAGLNALARHLQERDLPNLPVEVVRVASVNHSFFFREPEVLQFFLTHILPVLPEDENWRFWSAATASGEEAYSVAILLCEALGLAGAQQKASILGTDISHPMIQQAEAGIYLEAKMDLVSDATRRRYFQRLDEEQWQVRPELKRLCTFRRLNLNSQPWPFQQRFHVALCRNVLYYFDRPTQAELIDRIYDGVVPGGWLITSVTETLQNKGLDSGTLLRWKKVMVGVYRK